MYYLETAKGYTGKEIVQKAGNESTRYKRAPLRGTIADAILDRLINSSHRIDLKGESMRKLKEF